VQIDAERRAPLHGVLMRCLAKDPRQRYERTDDLAADVRRARDDVRRRSERGGLSRRRWLVASGVAAAGAAAAWWWRPMTPGVRSVAVLPFRNPSGDNTIDYICVGVADGIIQRLSRVGGLSVRSRAAGESVVQAGLNVSRAASVLGVDALVTGTVVRRAGGLRIETQLMPASGGDPMWTRVVDTSESQLLIAQTDLTSSLLAEGLGFRLNSEERRRFAQAQTNDPAAHDLYLQALYFHRLGTEDGYTRARELLLEATKRDAGFARAFVALASTYTTAAVDGYLRPSEAWPDSIRYVGHALRLDPDLPDAHAERASLAFFFTWDFEEADREWDTAVRGGAAEINPDLYIGYAVKRWASGDVDESVRLVDRALAAAPLSVSYLCKRGDFLAAAGRLDDACASYLEALKISPDDPRALSGIAEARRRQGRLDEAVAALRQVFGFPDAGDGHDAREYQRLERMAAGAEIEALEARRAAGMYVSPLDPARAWARLGEFDRAFSYFESAFVERAPDLVFLKVDPVWEPVRTHPRLVAAMNRVGLS
jgi:TolB-like protein/tetratricopeptide (TPR) repeat protein